MKRYYPALKWLILIAAYSYLAYMLWQFCESGDTGEIWHQWKHGLARNLRWLALVFALLPLNWLAESRKWQLLLRGVERISLTKAFRSVLGGSTAGFFTPNRVGEFPARTMFLNKGNRANGIVLGLIGTLSQTLIIIACGVPAMSFYFSKTRNSVQPSYLLFVLILFAAIIIVYLWLPVICRKISSFSFFRKTGKYLAAISQLKTGVLLQVLFFSAFRYAVYCTQFYFMLRFFDVELTLWQGAVGIAVNYLFVTFTPSVGFSEGVVRSSVATLVLKAFSANIAGIAVASISIWLVNFVLPMMVGSVFVSKTKL